MYEQINRNISRFVSFTQEELDIFNSLLEEKKIPKKTFLLRQGEVCNFEFYVNKGCIRKYYIDENGSEVVVQFAIEDSWISDIASFHDRTPSYLYIETMEDCELLLMTREKKEALLMQVPKFERVYRLLVQRSLSSLQGRLIHTIARPAHEKYLEFLEKYPDLPQRVAQHYIASYLGISPEFLSKVRARLAQQK